MEDQIEDELTLMAKTLETAVRDEHLFREWLSQCPKTRIVGHATHFACSPVSHWLWETLVYKCTDALDMMVLVNHQYIHIHNKHGTILVAITTPTWITQFAHMLETTVWYYVTADKALATLKAISDSQ